MKNIVVAILFGGCLLLALAATGWQTVADAVASRGGWQPALELRTTLPQCWNGGVLSYCRLDWSAPQDMGRVRSMHFLSVAPIGNRALVVRSTTIPGHITSATALDRLGERLGVFAVLLVLLALTTWRVVLVLTRQWQQEADVGQRMAQSGWRVAPPHQDEPVRVPRSSSSGTPSFGRRH